MERRERYDIIEVIIEGRERYDIDKKITTPIFSNEEKHSCTCMSLLSIDCLIFQNTVLERLKFVPIWFTKA